MVDLLVHRKHVLVLLEKLRDGYAREAQFRVDRMAKLTAQKRLDDARYCSGQHDAYMACLRDLDLLIARVKNAAGYAENLL